MKAYISLNKNVDCAYLCNIVGRLLNPLVSNNTDLSNKVLCLEIRDITDESQSIPNIEHKDENGV